MSSAPRPSMASEAAALAVGSAISQGSAVLGLVLLAHILDKHQLGSYQQLVLLYAITSPLLLGGVPAAIQYFVPREEHGTGRRRWVFDAYVTLGALGIASAALMVVLRHPLADVLGNPGLARAIALYAPFVFCSFVSAVMPNALIVEGRARVAAALGALGAALTLAVLVGTALVTGDIAALAIAMSASAACLMILNTVAVLRIVGVEPPAALRHVRGRQLLAFGLPLAVTGIVSTLGFQFDRLVVAHHVPPQRYAIYAVGAIEVPIGILIRQSVNSVLVPALSQRHYAGDIRGMTELWRGTLRKSAMVTLPIFAFLMSMAPEVVRIVFGGRYQESAHILRVYLTLMPLSMMQWGVLPLAAGRPRMNIGGSAIMFVINAGLAIALIGPMGLYGPASATPIALLGVTIYFIVRSRRLLGVSTRDLIPGGALAGTLLISAVCTIPLVALDLLPLPDIVRVVVGIPVFSVPCVLWLRRGGYIDDLDWGRLMRLLGLAVHTLGRAR